MSAVWGTVDIGLRRPGWRGETDRMATHLRRPLTPTPDQSGAVDAFLSADLRRRRWVPSLHFISDYHDFDPYIEAMAERIRANPRVSGLLQKAAGLCLIGFGLKMVLTK